MDGLIDPSPLSQPKRESNWVPIGLGIVFVVLAFGVIAWFARSRPKPPTAPPPYAAYLKLSDLKMSAAQNFVGATVTYLDGTITNTGSQTVTHVMIHVTFQDSDGQVAQIEEVPLHVLKTTGPYPDAVDLKVSPLSPGQSQTFRLTFEHVSSAWNQAYPDLQISDVTTN